MSVYDLPNIFFILITLMFALRLNWIPFWLSFVLGFLAFTPFFLNYVLFDPNYMPDQFKYFKVTSDIRSLIFGSSSFQTVQTSGYFLALIPLPYVETIQSLGFFNRYIITLTIIWLYAAKNIRGWPLLFILLYPSLILYSSLALRDTLVLLFMLLPIVFFIAKMYP